MAFDLRRLLGLHVPQAQVHQAFGAANNPQTQLGGDFGTPIQGKQNVGFIPMQGSRGVQSLQAPDVQGQLGRGNVGFQGQHQPLNGNNLNLSGQGLRLQSMPGLSPFQLGNPTGSNLQLPTTFSQYGLEGLSPLKGAAPYKINPNSVPQPVKRLQQY